MSIITTSGLTMQFGAQRALDSLNVDVQSGVTGLVGANGAGKTTLMSLVLGLRVPTAGQASVLGFDPQTNGAQLRAQIGYGPERNVVPEDMPASDFVKHMAEVRGMPRSEARARASETRSPTTATGIAVPVDWIHRRFPGSVMRWCTLDLRSIRRRLSRTYHL